MSQDRLEDTLDRINLQPTKEKRLSSKISHLRKAFRYMFILVGLLSPVIFSSCGQPLAELYPWPQCDLLYPTTGGIFLKVSVLNLGQTVAPSSVVKLSYGVLSGQKVSTQQIGAIPAYGVQTAMFNASDGFIPNLVYTITVNATNSVTEANTNNNTATDSCSLPILAAHNKYRSVVGVPALVWSPNLASSAQVWANHLAAIHQPDPQPHSGPGENIWRGTKGAYNDTQKVDKWGAEKQYFLAGKPFPNFSTTGSWLDVGHYTQIIWSSTTSVGCGWASDSSSDYLVCQYSPPGNVIGQYPLGHP